MIEHVRQGEEQRMPYETRHESADLEDPSDTLQGNPGDDPLDRGVAAPGRWSAGVKFGSTADEQASGESLDQLLAEEEPDTAFDIEDDLVARDVGIDGGAASAEEAAVHVVKDDDTDIRSGD